MTHQYMEIKIKDLEERIAALEQKKPETVTEFTDRCQECGAKYGKLLKQKWIPCSERLPEDGDYVLFCDIDGDIMLGYHKRGRSETHFSQDGTFLDIKNVKAWMPLPEPYKSESEEKE